MNNLYEKLSELCTEKGVTLGKMCAGTGISRGLITDLKMGRKKNPASETLAKMAAYFDVTVDYLIGNTNIKKAPTVTVYDEDDNIIRLDDETLELIDALRSKPEMKMLFSVSKGATKDDIIKAVKIIEALKDGGGSSGE